MPEEFAQPSLKATTGAVKKYCFLCAVARYLTAFVLGIIVGLIWGSF